MVHPLNSRYFGPLGQAKPHIKVIANLGTNGVSFAIQDATDASINYHSGDILTVSGGTFANPAQILVITAANIVSAVSLDASDASAGYQVDDVLTVTGGTGVPNYQPTQIKVLTVNGSGKILTFQLIYDGNYSSFPPTPNSPTGGHGTGAVFDLTLVTGRIVEWEMIVGGSYSVNPSTPNVPTGGHGTGAKFDLIFGSDLSFYVVKQLSSTRYRISDGTTTGIIKLGNVDPPGLGQGYIPVYTQEGFSFIEEYCRAIFSRTTYTFEGTRRSWVLSNNPASGQSVLGFG